MRGDRCVVRFAAVLLEVIIYYYLIIRNVDLFLGTTHPCRQIYMRKLF